MKRWLFALAVMPWICLAALRVAWLYPRYSLEDSVERLRSIRFPLPRPLRRPFLLRGLVGRLLPVLPPPRAGRCLKRSLILLDLYSRCALQPRFFVGIKAGEFRPEGHAWIEAEDLPSTEMDRQYATIVEL